MAVYTLKNNPRLLDMVDLIPNIPFSKPDGETLAVQILKPRWSSGGKGFPMLFFIQGSAWTKPIQFWQLPQWTALARRGYVVASVTHRSSDTAPAPAFLKDVKTALRFLRAHAKEYDIAKERVCAFGSSSGANAALLLGLTENDPAFETEEWAGESTAVQAVVDCFGPTDIDRLFQQNPNLEQRLRALTSDFSSEISRQISPIRYIKPDLSLPPFMVIHGDADEMVPFEQSEVFYQALIENGYEADFVRVINGPHAGNFWSKELIELIFSFIEKHIGA